jgi:Mn2+/Fe2+ NRAMP family transporter
LVVGDGVGLNVVLVVGAVVGAVVFVFVMFVLQLINDGSTAHEAVVLIKGPVSV